MTERVPEGVEILDPTIRGRGDLVPAPRLGSLDGRTIGLLDNSKEEADVFLAAVAAALAARFRIKTIAKRKPTYSRVAPVSIIAELCARRAGSRGLPPVRLLRERRAGAPPSPGRASSRPEATP